jgi:hypothetical protein
MSFQAHFNSIKAQTGKSLDDFKGLAAQKDFPAKRKLKDGAKTGDILACLKANFDLGQVHVLAIFAAFKGRTE